MRRCAVAPSVSTVRSGGRTSRHGAAAQATRTDSRSIAVRSTTTSTRAVSVSPKSTILGWRVAVAAMPSPGALGVEPSEAARSSTKIPTRPAASMPTSAIAPAASTRRRVSTRRTSCSDHVARPPELRPFEERGEDLVTLAGGDEDGVEVEGAKPLEERVQPRLVRLPPDLGLSPLEADRQNPPCRGIAQRHDDAAHVRETLLPDRVLDHDRHEVPTMLDGGQPQLTGRRRDEVREEEDERARRHRARVLGEVRDRALEPVGGAAVLGRPQALVAQLDELPLAFRLPPVG